jgi:CRP-like cAMP-binding protein
MKTTDVSCEFCNSRGAARFCELAGLSSPTGKSDIVINRYQPRQTFMHAGDPPLAIYCIRSGLVKLYKVGRRGDPLIIRLLGPGRLIGYRAILAQEPYAATAEAVGLTTLCVIPGRYLLDLLQHSPEFSARMLKMMARELRYSEEQMMALAQETVRRRTVRLLLSFLEEAPPGDDNGSLLVPLLRKELAQMVGTSPETLSKSLHRLAREGVLRLTRSEIFVRDAAALRRLLPEPTA